MAGETTDAGTPLANTGNPEWLATAILLGLGLMALGTILVLRRLK